MTDSPFKFTIGLSVLNFLGPNLYSNIAAVLSEMAANAWDADAKKVDIDMNISKGEIVIKDDGKGMSFKEINEKYLYIGYLKREAGRSVTTSSGRHVMGRKGIGKLASFSFSREMQIYSNNDKEKVGCKIDWDEIELAIKEEKAYNPTSIEVNKLNLDRGTKVVLKKLKQDKVNDLKLVRRKLARRFLVIDNHKDFQINVDETPLSSKKDCPFYEKMQYVWYLGDASKNHLSLFPKLLRDATKLSDEIEIRGKIFKVRGWIGTVEFPSDIREDENNTIALYAYGKMIQEDILGELQEAQNYAQYIIGNIEVDFMDSDDEPDIVTSDRQRVIQDDYRYKEVKEFIRARIREVGRDWNLWRLEKKSASALEHPKVKNWYADLSPTSKRKATRILGKVDNLSNFSDEQREKLYIATIDQFNNVKGLSAAALKTIDDETFLSTLGVDLSASKPTATSETDKPQTKPSENNRPPSPPKTNVESNFNEIRKILDKFPIEEGLRNISLYDLDQAQKAYKGQAYKACVVMLGAILEGIMLGIIRRNDVLDKIITDAKNAPKALQKLGLTHPQLDRNIILGRITDELGFEEYKLIIHYLMPNIKKLRIDDIQFFRNTIHPWLAIKDPNVYGDIDPNRVSNLQTTLIMLLKQLGKWNP